MKKKYRLDQFRAFIWSFYKEQGRAFRWRNIENPYYVLVSEVMLQQTQTIRVETKYEQFIAEFPTFNDLAQASLRDVLSAWQGLGYYRRARYLHQIAQKVICEHNGILPDEPKLLQTFPGLGAATAASVCAFAFNKPTVFIETNIRTVFIHAFFQDKSSVSDKELMPFIAESLDHDNPREWYYALMDYGVLLKSQHSNPSRKSVHYVKQSKFEGSDRQIRAKILKMVTNTGGAVLNDFVTVLSEKDIERIMRIVQQLEHEKFIVRSASGMYTIM